MPNINTNVQWPLKTYLFQSQSQWAVSSIVVTSTVICLFFRKYKKITKTQIHRKTKQFFSSNFEKGVLKVETCIINNNSCTYCCLFETSIFFKQLTLKYLYLFIIDNTYLNTLRTKLVSAKLIDFWWNNFWRTAWTIINSHLMSFF